MRDPPPFGTAEREGSVGELLVDVWLGLGSRRPEVVEEKGLAIPRRGGGGVGEMSFKTFLGSLKEAFFCLLVCLLAFLFACLLVS